MADHPERYRLAGRAIAPEGGDLQFFCCPDSVELIAGPRCHRRLSLMMSLGT
jgi:hypothetical protein